MSVSTNLWPCLLLEESITWFSQYYQRSKMIIYICCAENIPRCVEHWMRNMRAPVVCHIWKKNSFSQHHMLQLNVVFFNCLKWFNGILLAFEKQFLLLLTRKSFVAFFRWKKCLPPVKFNAHNLPPSLFTRFNTKSEYKGDTMMKEFHHIDFHKDYFHVKISKKFENNVSQVKILSMQFISIRHFSYFHVHLHDKMRVSWKTGLKKYISWMKIITHVIYFVCVQSNTLHFYVD